MVIILNIFAYRQKNDDKQMLPYKMTRWTRVSTNNQNKRNVGLFGKTKCQCIRISPLKRYLFGLNIQKNSLIRHEGFSIGLKEILWEKSRNQEKAYNLQNINLALLHCLVLDVQEIK